MSELDEKQQAILESWKGGNVVAGYNGGEFGIEHAMMNAVTGPRAKAIGTDLMAKEHCNAGCLLSSAVALVARDLAAAHMGYPYLMDAEEAMKIENFSITIKSTSLAEIFYTVGDAEIEKSIDIEVSFDDGEPSSEGCPGFPAMAEIIGTDGLSIAESHQWTKCLHKNIIQLEDVLWNARKQENQL